MGVWRRISEEETLHYTEEYSEPCETSKKERFAKIVNDFRLLIILAKHSILDFW